MEEKYIIYYQDSKDYLAINKSGKTKCDAQIKRNVIF